MHPYSDDNIIDSWKKNASPWITAVRNEQIESRKLLTNAAIIDAVLSRPAHTVLDVGCGEGWLARELSVRGLEVTGVDVVPSLIDAAQAAGGGTFLTASYEAVTGGALPGRFDLVVCNFSLIGKESVEGLFHSVPELLNPAGACIVQTLHPVTACGDRPYLDGWRGGSWDGFSAEFVDPAQWYFRTLESWVTLFSSCGFQLLEMREPIHSVTGMPASVIFIAELAPR